MPRRFSPYDQAKDQRQLLTMDDIRPRLWAWWDFTDPTSMTFNGSAISQINDKGQNGFHLAQATSGLQPTYSGIVSNLAGATFSSSKLRNAAVSLTGTKAMFFILLRYGGASSNGRAMSLAVGTSQDYNSQLAVIPLVNTGRLNIYRSSTATGNVTATVNKTYLVASGATGANMYFGVDGDPAPATSANTNAFGSDNVAIGCSTWTDTEFINGLYSEVIVVADYDLALKQVIEGYLAWRPMAYGSRLVLDALDNRHPFKNRPPLVSDI